MGRMARLDDGWGLKLVRGRRMFHILARQSEGQEIRCPSLTQVLALLYQCLVT